MLNIIPTADQSFTIYSEQFDQTYHSIHGAKAESMHVFIQYGLKEIAKKQNRIGIFEMGFGTGLNAVLTWQYAIELNLQIQYHTIEKYPLKNDIYSSYCTPVSEINQKLIQLHQADWNQAIAFPHFEFTKYQKDIHDFLLPKNIDLIYYDAFAPNAQPDLWTEEIFKRLYEIMNPNGILTTYCAKGSVKRALKSCGFEVYSPTGPMGKREMTVAKKRI